MSSQQEQFEEWWKQYGLTDSGDDNMYEVGAYSWAKRAWQAALSAQHQAGEPVAWWHYRINGAHDGFEQQMPPDDACDEGTLTALYTAPPRAQLLRVAEAVREKLVDVYQEFPSHRMEVERAMQRVDIAAIVDAFQPQTQADTEFPTAFVTTESGNGKYKLVLSFASISDLHKGHDRILAAVSAATQPEPVNQQMLAERDSDTVIATLDTQQWKLSRAIDAEYMTDEYNKKNAWFVERNFPPYADKEGNRIWTGPTAIAAFKKAHAALEMAAPSAIAAAEAAQAHNHIGDSDKMVEQAQQPEDGVVLDAERYRLLRRGQHWSVVDAVGDVLRADEIDEAVDAALAAHKAQEGQP